MKREVLRNRIVREGRINVNARRRNICRSRGICTVSGLCGPHCQGPCKQCTRAKCNDRCPHFEPRECERLGKNPYVCNSCDLLDFKGVCDRQRMFYDAVAAQDRADEGRAKAGRKPAIGPEDIAEMTEILRCELKKGHSPEYIWAHRPEAFKISARTFYNYVEQGMFDELKMILPRYVRYSRTPKKKPSAKGDSLPGAMYDGRRYDDFKALPEAEKRRAVEVDCVEGKKDGCAKVVLTLLFREDNFQPMILLYSKTKEEVARAYDRIERCIGLEAFQSHFGLQLTGQGSEFKDFPLLEASCTVPGERRCRIYYCDPSAPEQKGACERNHAEMRKIIPSKKVKRKASFKKLTEADVSLLCNHVNSHSRPKLGHRSPLGLAKGRLPEELFGEFGVTEIDPDEVILKPSLLPHLF